MLNNKIRAVLLYFFYPLSFASAQSSKLFDSLNIYPLSALSLSEINFNQLKPFENILNRNDVLILSEGGHADGATYDAQCMIVKGLIEQGKISTVYTESSWLNIEKINSILKKYGKDSINSAEKYISSIELFYWTRNGFWNYLAEKIINNKVNLIGIDIETTSSLITVELLNEAMLKDNIFSKNEYKEVIADLSNPLQWTFDVNYSEAFYKKSRLFIQFIMQHYSSENNLYKVKQWQRILDYQYFRYYRNFDNNGFRVLHPFDNGPRETYFNSIRDSVMCDILLENYTNKNSGKAVLLIASYHAMQNSELIEKLDQCLKYNYVKTFGEILNRRNILKFYNICFVTSSGKRGTKQDSKKYFYKVKKPKKGSFEDYFSKQKYSYFFTDLESFSAKKTKFFMNPFNKKYLYADWAKIFSGIFFIKEMYPQDLDKRVQ